MKQLLLPLAETTGPYCYGLSTILSIKCLQVPLNDLKYYFIIWYIFHQHPFRGLRKGLYEHFNVLMACTFHFKPNGHNSAALASLRVRFPGPPLPVGVCRRGRNLSRQSGCAYSWRWAESSDGSSFASGTGWRKAIRSCESRERKRERKNSHKDKLVLLKDGNSTLGLSVDWSVTSWLTTADSARQTVTGHHHWWWRTNPQWGISACALDLKEPLYNQRCAYKTSRTRVEIIHDS